MHEGKKKGANVQEQHSRRVVTCVFEIMNKDLIRSCNKCKPVLVFMPAYSLKAKLLG
jgi:hypothetical protein